MKKLSFLGKFIFFINSIFAILLLASYLLPFIPPHLFPALSVLSLALPVLLIINVLFFTYWTVRGRRQLLLSAIVLTLGITHILALFRFSTAKDMEGRNTLKVLTYNVRQFNAHGWTKEVKVGERIIAFINNENPDVVGLQEYHPDFALSKELFPYVYREMSIASRFFGQAIYSKYPIINTGSLDFEKTANNVIYADIATPTDTIRYYNVHFQSFSLSPSVKKLKSENSKRLLGRLGAAFAEQEAQVKKCIASEATSVYPVILAGDFNNSATSYMYRKVRGEKVDAFAKAGSGTGATFWFDFIPLRIDFILADQELSVIDFKTYNLSLSDHKPSMAIFKLKD